MLKETYNSENYTLGRKSNRKKATKDLLPAIEAEVDQKLRMTIQIGILGAVSLICGILLFNKTFISTQAQIAIIILGAIIGTRVSRFFLKNKNYGSTTILTLGLFAAPIPYGFVATTNYYIGYNKTEKVRLDILAWGNRSKRKGGCKTPYVVVEFDNMNKEIKFDCDYEASISQYNSVTLTIAKGLWGLTVYTNQVLNE